MVLGATGTFMFASAATAMAATTGTTQPQTASSVSTVSEQTAQWRLTVADQKVAAKNAAAVAAAKHAAAVRLAAAKEAAADKKEAAARKKAQAARKRQAAAPSGTPQQIAMAMLGQYGWSSSQFSCLNLLWQRESNWEVYADNPSSGAYGIPQALPGYKMASAGSDWQTSAYTQIKWGLGYIRDVYGSPCGAWSHETSYGWY